MRKRMGPRRTSPIPPEERFLNMLQQGYLFGFLAHRGGPAFLTRAFFRALPGLRECLDGEMDVLQRSIEGPAADRDVGRYDSYELQKFCIRLMDEAMRDDAPPCVRRIRRFAGEISARHPITGEGVVGICAIYVYNERHRKHRRTSA